MYQFALREKDTFLLFSILAFPRYDGIYLSYNNFFCHFDDTYKPYKVLSFEEFFSLWFTPCLVLWGQLK